MRMLCYKCDHPWNYKGRNSEGKGYITCPGCYYKIRVDKALVEEPFKQELLTTKTKLPILPIQRLPKLPIKLLSSKAEIPTTHHPLLLKEVPYEDSDNEELDEDEFEEQESSIRILPPRFEIIRVIPYDPIKHLNHMKNF